VVPGNENWRSVGGKVSSRTRHYTIWIAIRCHSTQCAERQCAVPYADLRSELARFLGLEAAASRVESVTRASTRRDEYAELRIDFSAADGEQIPAFLLVPHAESPVGRRTCSCSPVPGVRSPGGTRVDAGGHARRDHRGHAGRCVRRHRVGRRRWRPLLATTTDSAPESDENHGACAHRLRGAVRRHEPLRVTVRATRRFAAYGTFHPSRNKRGCQDRSEQPRSRICGGRD
jgi:hypothetical protein